MINNRMMMRLVMRQVKIANRQIRLFGGGGVPITDFNLHANKKYINCTDEDRKYCGLIPLQSNHTFPKSNDDVFFLQREICPADMDSWYYSDPHHGRDIDDPLINTPHGYITSDDPMDTRNDVRLGLMLTVVYLLAGFILSTLIGFQGSRGNTNSEMLYESNLAAKMIEQQILEIRQTNHDLEQTIVNLKQQLEQINLEESGLEQEQE